MTQISTSELKPFSISDAVANAADTVAPITYVSKAQLTKIASKNVATSISPSVTRIAVELTLPCNHVSSNAAEPLLQAIHDLLSLDCLFVALFDSAGQKIEWINTTSVDYAHCNPYELLGAAQPCSNELLKHFENHRMLAINDSAKQGREHADFTSRMMNLNLGSMLVGGIINHGRAAGFMVFGSLRSRRSWDADSCLMMKLMSASYAAGHERCQMDNNADQ